MLILFRPTELFDYKCYICDFYVDYEETFRNRCDFIAFHLILCLTFIGLEFICSVSVKGLCQQDGIVAHSLF